MLCFVSVCMYVSVGAWIRLCRLWFNKQDPLLPLRTAGSLTAPAQICCEAGVGASEEQNLPEHSLL